MLHTYTNNHRPPSGSLRPNRFPLPNPRDERVSPATPVATVSRWLGLLLWLLSVTGMAGIDSVTLQPNLETYSRLTPEVTATVKLTTSNSRIQVKFNWYRPDGVFYTAIRGTWQNQCSASLPINQWLPGIWLGNWSVGVAADSDGDGVWSAPERTLPVTISAEPPYSYQSLLGPEIATTGVSQSQFATQDPQLVLTTNFLYYTYPFHTQKDYFYHYTPTVRQ